MSTVNNQTSELRPVATELIPAAAELKREVAVAMSTPTTRADDRSDWDVKRGQLENCTTEPRKAKMVLHDDLIRQILLWLPVVSLLRLRHACRSWRALIESSYFIKRHLHRHHSDPRLKDKNHNLIYLPRGASENSPLTFPLTPIEGFEEPKVCLQLNCSDLHGYFPVQEIVSYNGIICLNLLNSKIEGSICLWNPATKQSRVLPQSPFLNKDILSIGFGYDIKNNDYKVVKISSGSRCFEVYSLNTSSWKSLTAVVPFGCIRGSPSMPFNNGTCFFWARYNSTENIGYLCFDFSSEIFRSISLPPADCYRFPQHMSVVHDKIACVLCTKDDQTEIWVFNEYGTTNESWIKFYTVDTYSIIDKPAHIRGVSMNGNYIFFERRGQVCRLNVVTEKTNCFTLENMPYSCAKTMVGYKESLVSVGEGN